LGPRAAAEPAPPPIQVMVVGDFHFANPGRDRHNVEVDDVLAPGRQAELSRIADALSRFAPTKVAAEWPAAIAAERYRGFLAGTLPASRNEVVQLGFRLARKQGLGQVYGLDVPGPFPFDAVTAYANAHGQEAVVEAANDAWGEIAKKEQALLAHQGVSATLRYLNDPAVLTKEHDAYRTLLRVGGGDDQPGAELLAAWYRRNFLICAKLLQIASPGDRIVVFFGAGHAFLLRQCITETPGLTLVEPNLYLPR
ncbi:MAG: DUF5694 domain-containing protein, partial [Caulobacteraceae bacterium]